MRFWTYLTLALLALASEDSIVQKHQGYESKADGLREIDVMISRDSLEDLGRNTLSSPSDDGWLRHCLWRAWTASLDIGSEHSAVECLSNAAVTAIDIAQNLNVINFLADIDQAGQQNPSSSEVKSEILIALQRFFPLLSIASDPIDASLDVPSVDPIASEALSAYLGLLYDTTEHNSDTSTVTYTTRRFYQAAASLASRFSRCADLSAKGFAVFHPFQPNVVIPHVVFMHQFDSKHSPVLLAPPEGHQFILKRDDVTPEQSAMLVFGFANSLWLSHSDKFPRGLVPFQKIYGIKALNKKLGLVEVVPETRCIRDFEVAEDHMDEFIRSLAGSFVINYVMGTVDRYLSTLYSHLTVVRHYDNILFQETTGHAFNIDFGAQWGDRPIIDASRFPMTSDIAKVLQSSEGRWDEFINLCVTSFEVLRASREALAKASKIAFRHKLDHKIESRLAEVFSVDITSVRRKFDQSYTLWGSKSTKARNALHQFKHSSIYQCMKLPLATPCELRHPSMLLRNI